MIFVMHFANNMLGFMITYNNNINELLNMGHLFSTYINIFEKLTFFTPWYCVHIRGWMLVFQKVLRTY